MRIQILAAKILAILIMVFCEITSVHAGIPVIDGANVAQDTVTATEQVAQTLKQIEQYTTQLSQYSTQLNQYSNMLQNTMTPSSYLWDAAKTTMGNLLSSINTLNTLKTQYGNLTNYLNQYQNTTSYMGNSCFTTGCTASQWAAIANSRIAASSAQKSANDASISGLDQQQSALTTDATTLESLQASAQSATGQMQAIGYANQIASSQANQLLQIRGLLIAQQNALVTRQQALADQEAQQAAAAAQIRTGTFVASPVVSWK